MTEPPFGCTNCDTRWSGENTCHCGKCHRNFSCITAFDLHRNRRNGDCKSPRRCGLVKKERAGYEVYGEKQ